MSLLITQSSDYEATLRSALHRCGGGKDAVKRRLVAMVDRLQDHGRLVGPAWKQEGTVKDRLGHEKRFYAISYKSVRIYVVLIGNVALLSHAIYKDQNKLDPADTTRVETNYRLYLDST